MGKIWEKMEITDKNGIKIMGKYKKYPKNSKFNQKNPKSSLKKKEIERKKL